MPLPARHFLGWEVPLPLAAARWLLRHRDRLPETLVIVPTGQSARRLRQALAQEGGGAVFSPRMMTPDILFRPEDAGGVAGEAIVRAAWHEVLLQAPLPETEALRPEGREDFVPDRAWTSGWIDLILPTLDTLGEVELRPEEVPARCPATVPDARKWESIGHLARRVEQRLAAIGLIAPEMAKRQRAHEGAIPTGIERIVLAGVPDPVPLARLALDQWMEQTGMPVDVLVHSPADMEGLFDVWGMPEREGWKAATLPLPRGNESIVITRDDEDLARATVLACVGRESSEIALGCPDETLLPALERAFAAAAWPLYNPAGRTASSTGLAPALSFWLDLFGSQPAPFAAVNGFLRSPAAWDWLRGGGIDVEPFRLATTLDLLAVEFLPETLGDASEAALHWPEIGGVPKRYLQDALTINKLQRILTELTESARQVDTQGLAAVTRLFFERLASTGHDDGAGGKVIERLIAAVDDLDQLESHFSNLSIGDRAALWRATLPKTTRPEDETSRVLDVQGWLELPYESAPHLIIAGMVEGKVPNAPQENGLLPDSVRRTLGLRDRESRAVRDAFLWRSIVACRESAGSVTVVIPKFDGRGEPRRPSSLLFRCLPAELPGRVAYCFRDLEASRSPRPPTRRGNWSLDFAQDAGKAGDAEVVREFSISPTRIRDYLECPFRYYLRHVLGMEEIDPNPRQWDARKFGNVMHHVLWKFGQNEEIRDCTRAETIHAFLMESLDEWLEINHGDGLSLPLNVQVASARERLRAFAYVQATERTQGWEIRQVEWGVGRGNGPSWSLAGAKVSMTLDRVDFHPATRTWRVLDYKTGGVDSVEKEHLEPDADWKPRLGHLVPPSGREKKARRWRNVQLPLYAAFLRQSDDTGPGVRPGDTIRTGYVLLSRAASEIGFKDWTEYNEDLEASALAWSEEAVRRIRAGVFGPPATAPGKAPPSPWNTLAPDGWEAALARPLPAGFNGEEVPT